MALPFKAISDTFSMSGTVSSVAVAAAMKGQIVGGLGGGEEADPSSDLMAG